MRNNLFSDEMILQMRKQSREINGPKVYSGKKPYSTRGNTIKFYQIDEDTFFHQTYNQGNAPRQIHPGLRGILAQDLPIAQTEYEGSKSGHITTYLIKGSVLQIDNIAKSIGKYIEIRTVSDINLGSKVDEEYNIFSQHTANEDLIIPLKLTLRHDIQEFCHSKPATKKIEKKELEDTAQNNESKKIRENQHYVRLENLIHSPEFSVITPNKNKMVKFGKGQYEKTCLLDIGIDTSEGCPANTTPLGEYDPTGKCSFCYAFQSGIFYLSTVYDMTENNLDTEIRSKIKEMDLEDKKVYFRIGQTVDANCPPSLRKLPGYRNNLEVVLNVLGNLAKEREIAVAMPTKLPQFDVKIAELMIAANVHQLVSITYEQLEKGIVNFGFDTKKRLEEMLKFGQFGVPTSAYIATDVTRGLNYLQDEAKRALDVVNDYSEIVSAQFLDMRITRRGDAPLIGGAPWSVLKSPIRDFMYPDVGHWGVTGQGFLHALEIHPEFLEMVGDNKGNVRLCSTHTKPKKCGKCFM